MAPWQARESRRVGVGKLQLSWAGWANNLVITRQSSSGLARYHRHQLNIEINSAGQRSEYLVLWRETVNHFICETVLL